MMKRIRLSRTSLLFLLLLAMSGCRKGDEAMANDFPTVEIISIFYNEDDASLTIRGKAERKNGKPIGWAGIYLSEDGDFEKQRNQAVSEVIDGLFEVKYYYYFDTNSELAPFAGGRSVYMYGFAIGDDDFGVSEVTQAGPFYESSLTIPCVLPTNQINYNGNVYSIPQTQHVFSSEGAPEVRSKLTVDFGSTDYYFEFTRFVSPGVYATASSLVWVPEYLNRVKVYNSNNTVAANQLVYVEDAGNGKYRVSLCDANMTTGTNHVAMRFLVVF